MVKDDPKNINFFFPSAMWLRDSTNQIISYIPYAKCDDKLKNLILGVIYMQAELIISVGFIFFNEIYIF